MPNAALVLFNGTNVRDLTWSALRATLLALFRIAMRVGSTLLPGRVESWAVDRFLTPKRHAHRAAELALLERGERFEVPLDVRKISAWSFGPSHAPVIVCSHGWSGRGAQFRHFVEPLLAHGFRVVLFDHPGHGFSAGRTSSLVEFASALQQVLNYLHYRDARIAGVIAHSLGGPATALAIGQSFHKPARVVLIAPPASLIDFSRRFARFLGLSERVRRGVQRRIEKRYGVAWAALELPKSVAGLRTPALIIHDLDDREVRIANGQAIARHWPDARLVTTSGLGHRAILKDAGVIQDAIDFLTGRVEFPRPQSAQEWDRAPRPAPIY
jgi:pimeloyl-ACP methyl ester carboxylesterase